MRTVDLCGSTPLKLPDAMYCATALEADCQYIISREQHLRQIGLNLAVVDEPAAIAALTEALFG